MFTGSNVCINKLKNCEFLFINKKMNIDNLSWPPLTTQLLDPWLLCAKCLKPMVYVHQADDCGCRYCYDCLTDLHLTSPQPNTAFCCRCRFRLASSYKIPDNYFQRKLNEKIVKCDHCDWLGSLLNYRQHYNTHFLISNM